MPAMAVAAAMRPVFCKNSRRFVPFDGEDVGLVIVERLLQVARRASGKSARLDPKVGGKAVAARVS
jgi:hypothetical protein